MIALCVGCDRPDAVPSTAGAAPQEITLLGLDDEPVRPFDVGQGKVKVFIFVRCDCPISNRYAPAIRQLFQQHSPDNVDWWIVYPNPTATGEAIQRHHAEFHYPGGVLRDGQHQLVQATGATVTPEAAVYGRDDKLVYCGRIDDRYVDFGRQRREPTLNDLAAAVDAAVDAAVAGRTAPTVRTKAIGCYIADLK